MFRRIAGYLVSKVPNVFTNTNSSPVVINEAHVKARINLKSAIDQLRGSSNEEFHIKKTMFTDNNLSQKEYSINELESLAEAYYEGKGLPQDINRAIEIWNICASKGSVNARYCIAMCKREGLGIEKNVEDCYKTLLELIKDHNHSMAHYSIATMLYIGDGVPVDHYKAFDHFKAAAVGGVPPAVYNLANMLALGQGVEKNEKKALEFYEMSASCGDLHAKFTLATWLSSGRGRDDGVKDPERAFSIFLEAALANHPVAAYNVGTMFFSGVGTIQDLDAARIWYDRAADSGVKEALVNLGNMYRQGLGVAKDLEKACAYFSRGAETNEVCKLLLEETIKEQKSESAST